MIRPALVIATAMLAFAGIFAKASLAQAPSAHQHSFSDAEKWAKAFDDPERDKWQKPHKVIQALALAPNFVVADIGSGTGYFSVRLSHFVSKGRVYGVDIEPDMVKYLADRAKRDGLSNVIAIAGAPDDPRLPTKVDLVIMVDVFHHIANRNEYFHKLQTYLKPRGRIAIIDFNETSAMGPPISERIAPDKVKAEMNKAGYSLVKEHTFLPNQFYLVFQRTKQ